VQFVEHDVEGKWPRLIMEYLPLGNLERQHQEQPISDKETLTILYQGLEALRYLSSRGISHRDLKPENILIYHRSPSCFRIKIGDFGLAKDASILRTTCGTQPYMAPEIWLGNRYTDKVDVWSLGVIVFQYGYGLPDFEDPFDPGNWYQQLRHEVLDWDSDDLIDLISSCMLNMRANERCTASECLEKGTKLWDGVIQSEINYGTPTELMSPANTAGIAKSLDKKLEERPESFEWPTLSSLQPENGAGQFTIQIFDDFDDEAVLYENLTNVEVPTHSSNNLEDMTATGDVNDATSLKPFFGEIGIVPQEGNQILLEDSGCITTKVNGLPVPMHKWDWLINASKLWTAAGKVGSERVTILKKLKQDSKAQGKNEVLWIPLQEAHDLSVSVGIASSLRPLFEYAIKHGAKTPGGFTLEQTIDGQKPETTRSIDKISYYTEMSYSENMCLPVMKGSF
jgi:serine/threonine protein kinase